MCTRRRTPIPDLLLPTAGNEMNLGQRHVRRLVGRRPAEDVLKKADGFISVPSRREDEREIRRITDAIPQTIMVQNPSGVPIYANQALLDMFNTG